MLTAADLYGIMALLPSQGAPLRTPSLPARSEQWLMPSARTPCCLHPLRYRARVAIYFESGDYIGLHRCAGLEMRTAMCSFLGKEVVVAIAVDRRVS